MNHLDRITFDPDQCGGRPCIRHYRLRVKDVLDLLGSGVAAEGILQDYPFLQMEDIQGCLQFAAAQANHSILSLS